MSASSKSYEPASKNPGGEARGKIQARANQDLEIARRNYLVLGEAVPSSTPDFLNNDTS
jgi:hypothetical protein